MTFAAKHPIEAKESWQLHAQTVADQLEIPSSRFLNHELDDETISALALEKEKAYQEKLDQEQQKAEKKRLKKQKKREKKEVSLLSHSGVAPSTVHGLMIDAGSSGSRLHVFEWEPRILSDDTDIELALSGRKLSFPTSNSRWTEKLRPGLSSFAGLPDDELVEAIANYLSPLIEFAQFVLNEKEESFGNFPIFLRATAGMRTLSLEDRRRIMSAVRDLFSDDSYCPFRFAPEQARTLSGEEEAVFGWAGVNLLLGDLIEQSEGVGTVVNPRLTYGSLDLGGASTQISYFDPSEDIMANLFKLQIGQGKHWNVYGHSFLRYGVNQATDRFRAKLADGKDAAERLSLGIFNPCFPGGVSKEIRTSVHFKPDQVETWDYQEHYASGNGNYNVLLKNDGTTGDFDACMDVVEGLLHLDQNEWCNFSHKKACSFAGAYQPPLPTQSDQFGEFLAFSNYREVWEFLDLPDRASLRQLENATRYACSMSHNQVMEFNNGRADDDEVDEFCFRSVYVLQLLRNGYGFGMDDFINAVDSVNGQKVGWALGAMLYEINTLPWSYKHSDVKHLGGMPFARLGKAGGFFVIVVASLFAVLAGMLRARKNRQHHLYETIKDAAIYA